jgi:hypothetical protein
MWVKLSGEYLNLDHVTRVRFSRSWKNGQEELGAEVEVLHGGALQGLTRYRGRDAEVLQAALGERAVADDAGPGPAVAAGPRAATRDTMHDV